MPYSKRKKRGCPKGEGIDAKSFMRCRGITRMCDWVYTPTGWANESELQPEEKPEYGLGYMQGRGAS